MYHSMYVYTVYDFYEFFRITDNFCIFVQLAFTLFASNAVSDISLLYTTVYVLYTTLQLVTCLGKHGHDVIFLEKT